MVTHAELLGSYEEIKKEKEEVETKLEETTTTCSKLEAELEDFWRRYTEQLKWNELLESKLEHQNTELQNQLAKWKLNANGEKHRLLRQLDELEHIVKRREAHIASLEEIKSELQQTIRRQQEAAANDTYACLLYTSPSPRD